MITEVFIEGQRLDLFDNESIELNRSVQDIKDISKIYTDFTQSFTVPASKNNNKIFKHFENPDIDNGYDTRTKKDATLLINSFDFLKGRIRLEKVQVKNNKAADYTITFFGNLVSLKDLVGEDKLKDLDYLSQFDHPYTFDSVFSGVSSSLNFTVDAKLEDVIRYPLLSPIRRFIFDTNIATTTNTATITNISYNDVNQSHGIDYYELKPSIGLEWIIKAIEVKYGITFSGDFFSREEFKALQLWLSKEKGLMSSAGKSLVPFPDNGVVFNSIFTGTVNGPLDGSSDMPPYYKYTFTVTPTTADKYDIIIEDNGQPFKLLSDVSGVQTVSGVIREFENNKVRDFKLGFYLKSDFGIIYDSSLAVSEHIWTGEGAGYTITNYNTSLLAQPINTTVRILQQMPDLTIKDFLSGLFKMFNLTVIPNGDTLAVESLEEWYLKGKIIDVSEYVDTTEVPVEKGTILKQIDLKFEKGESFLLEEFKNNFDRSYGDLNLILRDAQGNRLDGETMTIDLPFEQMIYERLTDVETGVLSEVQYGYVTDKEEKPYNLKAHLFYNVFQALDSNKPVALLREDSTPASIFNYNKPSHIGGLSLSKFATVFNADYDEYSGDAITSNLLTNYYLDYITDIFSSKRRVFSFKARLPENLIRSIKLNDRLVINGRRFLINNMNINLITKDADLELINDIYRGETQDSLTNKMILSSYFEEYNSPANTGSFTYTTNEEVNYLKTLTVEDLGYGTAWVVPTQNGNTINYTVAENVSGVDRYVAIKLTGRNLNDTYYKIQQNA